MACLECSYRDDMQIALNRVRQGEEDLDCPECGGILKSATISFGQSLVQRDLLRAEVAAQNCDLMIAIGTTLAVYPVAAVVPAAQRVGAKIAIINAEPTEMDHLADLVIRESISEVLSIAVSGVSNLPVEANEEEARDEKQS